MQESDESVLLPMLGEATSGCRGCRAWSGLAYLPAFALARSGLVHVQARAGDRPFECAEQSHLVWHPVAAARWQACLVDAMRKPDGARTGA